MGDVQGPGVPGPLDSADPGRSRVTIRHRLAYREVATVLVGRRVRRPYQLCES